MIWRNERLFSILPFHSVPPPEKRGRELKRLLCSDSFWKLKMGICTKILRENQKDQLIFYRVAKDNRETYMIIFHLVLQRIYESLQ